MTSLLPSSPRPQILTNKRQEEDASLQAIKDWLAKQPHLPDTWDEVLLMNFLRGCNFSLEKCKNKLDKYFTMRAAVPEFFTDRDVTRPELQDIAKYARVVPLPILTAEGRRIILSCFVSKDFGHISLEESFKLLFMLYDMRLAEEKIDGAGDVHIFDTANFSPSLATKLNPSIIRKLITCGLEAYPMKMKEFHIINVHPLIEMVFRWVKPFLKVKIVKRVHFHASGYESLYEFIPKHILPEEYGGTGGKVQEIHDRGMKRLEDYTQWFKEQEKFIADESKRPRDVSNEDGIFGIDGSFKQLNVD